jgi:hypothetical protein
MSLVQSATGFRNAFEHDQDREVFPMAAMKKQSTITRFFMESALHGSNLESIAAPRRR